MKIPRWQISHGKWSKVPKRSRVSENGRMGGREGASGLEKGSKGRTDWDLFNGERPRLFQSSDQIPRRPPEVAPRHRCSLQHLDSLLFSGLLWSSLPPRGPVPSSPINPSPPTLQGENVHNTYKKQLSGAQNRQKGFAKETNESENTRPAEFLFWIEMCKWALNICTLILYRNIRHNVKAHIYF